MRRDFAEMTELSDSFVREFTGLSPVEPAGAPTVLDRAGWIRANIDGFARLLSPLEEKLGPARGIGRQGARAALGMQIGLLLGYLAQKVLGQYDLLLAAEAGGRVYFVGPNVAAAERRAGLPPRDFRLWITLHEITHRTQFTAVPWLRDHVKMLIGNYLSSVEIDARRLREMLARARDLLLRGPAEWRRANVFTLFLTPAQQETVARMQALMTVIEGHGNFVMNRIGAERIPSYAAMHAAFARRREQVSLGERALQKAFGLDLKYQQYSAGEAFVSAVSDRAGMAGVNRVWNGPDSLPRAEEIADPGAWLARVEDPEAR